METQTPQEQDKQTVQKIVQAFSMLETRFSTFRRDALRNYRYVVGDQLDKETLDLLKEEKRPALVFNLLKPIIKNIAGILSQNKQAMKATPLRFGDELLAELHSALVSDFAVEGCDGYEEIVKAAIDAVIGKIGWVNTHWSTRRNPEGEAIIEASDPFMHMFDSDGKKIDQSDWRYQSVSAMYGADEIISIYGEDISPEMVQKIKDEASRLEGAYKQMGTPAGWLDRVITGVRNIFSSSSAESLRDSHVGLINTFADSRNGLYRVIEWHEKRALVRKWLYSPATREQKEIPAEVAADPEQLQAMMQQFPGTRIVPINEEQIWVIVCAPGLLPDDVILEKPYAVQGKGFQHKPIFCDSFHPDLLQTGSVVDDLISPLDSYNQRRMTMLEYLMDTVNPKINYPIGSIPAEELDNWKSKERGALRGFNVVGGMGPEPATQTMDRNALAAFIEEDRDLVQKISSTTNNVQGYSETSNEPASLYRQRVQQGMVMMQYFNSHVLRAMRGIFRYTDAMLQEFMTFPRQVRLLSEPPEGMPGIQKISQGEQDTYWLQVNWPTMQGMMNDLSQGEYDFKPDFSQLGETARQMKFIEAMEFIKTVPQDLVLWPELFKLWDNPASEKMAQYAEQMMGQALQAKQQQLQLQQAAGETQLLASAAQSQQQLDPIQQAAERTAA